MTTIGTATPPSVAINASSDAKVNQISNSTSMPDTGNEVIPEEVLESVIMMIQEMLGLFQSNAEKQEGSSGFLLNLPDLSSFSGSENGSSFFSGVTPVPTMSLDNASSTGGSSGSQTATVSRSVFDVPGIPSLTGSKATNDVAPAQSSLLGNLPEIPSLTGSNSSLPSLTSAAATQGSPSSSVFDVPGIPSLTGTNATNDVAPAQSSMLDSLPSIPSLTGSFSSLPSLTSTSASGNSSAASGSAMTIGVPSLTGSSGLSSPVSSTNNAVVPGFGFTGVGSGTSSNVPSLGVSSSSSSPGGSISTGVPSLTGAGALSLGSGLNLGVPSLVGSQGLNVLTNSGFSIDGLQDSLDDLQISSIAGNNTSSHWK